MIYATFAAQHHGENRIRVTVFSQRCEYTFSDATWRRNTTSCAQGRFAIELLISSFDKLKLLNYMGKFANCEVIHEKVPVLFTNGNGRENIDWFQ